jgi:hypothetical protein
LGNFLVREAEIGISSRHNSAAPGGRHNMDQYRRS